LRKNANQKIPPMQGGEKQLTLLEVLLALSLSEGMQHRPTFSPSIADPLC
jgi:hypothetical protein